MFFVLCLEKNVGYTVCLKKEKKILKKNNLAVQEDVFKFGKWSVCKTLNDEK